jgi:hypothetical protein
VRQALRPGVGGDQLDLVEITPGHGPMFAQPTELARMLAAIADDSAASTGAG